MAFFKIFTKECKLMQMQCTYKSNKVTKGIFKFHVHWFVLCYNTIFNK